MRIYFNSENWILDFETDHGWREGRRSINPARCLAAAALRCSASGRVVTASPRKLKKIDGDLLSRRERTRWLGAIALGEFAESDPKAIWPLTIKHGSRRHADVRIAIATCVLEHILEYPFEKFFERVANAAKDSASLADTARSCWLMGRSELRRNTERWEKLMTQLEAMHVGRVKPRKGKPKVDKFQAELERFIGSR